MSRYCAVVALLLLPSLASAGLHLSLETVNDLPARWRGYLPDQRRLRALAIPTLDTSRSASLTHTTYTDALLKLEAVMKTRALTADESADLGALYVRLGMPEKGVTHLRDARREHPEHYRLAANLGTAWQMSGDLAAAAEALDDAVRLAPPQWKAAEAAHRKLVRLRRAEKNKTDLDALFDGKPLDALPIAQQLGLWLPADGRILWQLGELAYATGDVRTAANILDGCVAEFGLAVPKLRDHRLKYRAEADALEARNEHAKVDESHFKSLRALSRSFDERQLPKIDPHGVNTLPWLALTETTVARPFRPQFLKYVQQLDGQRVLLHGHMRPLDGGKGGNVTSFLLTEYAIGCWFCEIPDPMSLVYVELKDSAEVTRDAIQVEGILRLNRDDPEAHLFRLEAAIVKVAD